MPTQNEVLQKVKEIIADLTNRDHESISASDALSKFGFDANGLKILCNKVNDEFELQIKPSEISNCETVNDVVLLVMSKLP